MKNKGILIVMEGACDGIGKTTQYNKLKERLTSLGYEVVSHHFPSYNTFQGMPVTEYLNGTFGTVKEVNPYFINTLYAVDRACTWELTLKKEYENGKVILLDRYTTSSLIYQSANFNNLEEKKNFIDYVTEYEYHKLAIPEPDMVIYLTAPFEVANNLRTSRKDYEGNSNDIHESNLEYMQKVYDNAEFIADYLNFTKIECAKNNEMKSINDIHNNIFNEVKTKVLKK